jgi:hypothetical protein
MGKLDWMGLALNYALWVSSEKAWWSAIIIAASLHWLLFLTGLSARDE